MKRLFVLKNSAGNLATVENGRPLYFESKHTAKQERNWRNDFPGNWYTVSLGPDHRNYKVK